MTFLNNEQIMQIIEKPNLTIKEKLEELDSLLISSKFEIENAKRFIVKDYIYCDKCNDYYKEKAWDKKKKTITTLECTNPLTGGYLDPYEYEKVTKEVLYYECPKGHQIVDDYGC